MFPAKHPSNTDIFLRFFPVSQALGRTVLSAFFRFFFFQKKGKSASAALLINNV